MRVLVTQSNFMPWRGFFSMLFNVDKVVFLENVQYTKRDWRNRNIVRKSINSNEGIWLTVPILGGGSRSQLISEVQLSDFTQFSKKVIRLVTDVYGNSDFFGDINEILQIFRSTKKELSLSELNLTLLKCVIDLLEIEVEVDKVERQSKENDASERIKNIVLSHGGDSYLTGPSAKNYLKEEMFKSCGINIKYAKFSELPARDDLISNLGYEFSIIDCIARLGISQTRELTYVKLAE